MTLSAQAEPKRREAEVLSKAVVRAADLLGVDHEDLAIVVGLTAKDVSHLRDGSDALIPESPSFKSAMMFVRLFRSLDAIVGGNSSVAPAWLRNDNAAFNAPPFEKMKNAAGLREVVDYLDAKRAPI